MTDRSHQPNETEMSLKDPTITLSNNTDDLKIKLKDPDRKNLVNRSQKPLLLEDSHRTSKDNDQSWQFPAIGGVDKSGTIDGNILVGENSSFVPADESRR